MFLFFLALTNFSCLLLYKVREKERVMSWKVGEVGQIWEKLGRETMTRLCCMGLFFFQLNSGEFLEE